MSEASAARHAPDRHAGLGSPLGTCLKWGAVLASIYLLGALWLLPDYGPTWDTAVGEFPYGDRLVEYFQSGDERWLDLMAREPEPRVRQPHPDYDVRRTEWYVVHPFAPIFSGVACHVLWTRLGWMDAQSAHHFPTVVFVALLLVAVCAFVGTRYGLIAGVASAAFLITCPRFFAHSFVNLKDGPMCVVYTLAMLSGYLALTGEKRRWWILTGALVGLGLATKANALFLPVQLGLFFGLGLWFARRRGGPGLRFDAAGFGWAALAFLLAYYAVSPNYWARPIEGPGLRIGHMLRAGNALFSPAEEDGVALRGVSFESVLQVGVTTPILVLALAAVGLFSKELKGRERIFLALGIAVPIGRNLIPGMANYDGIRHFLEFLPFLAIAAGLGLVQSSKWIAQRTKVVPRLVGALLLFASLSPSLIQVVRTHPYGIAYFNALAGGLGGAQERGYREATEYWGSSYKQGLAWLNTNAKENARIYVPIADHVAQAGRPYLREGLRFWNPEADETNPAEMVYVMYITRQRFYSVMVKELEKTRQPVHEIHVQGGTVLRIFEIAPEGAEKLWESARANSERRKARNRLWNWLKRDPARVEQLQEITQRAQGQGFEAALAAMRELFPPELHADIRPAAEYLVPSLAKEKP